MNNYGLDLLLIDPPVTSSMRFGKLATAGSFLPSLALVNLGTMAQKAGFSVKIIDASLHRLGVRELGERIIAEQPRWLGITATTLTINTVNELAKQVKKTYPRLVVIVGGAHMTAVPKQTMRKLKAIDIGVIGEGEVTLRELLETLNKDENLSGVKGIIWRNNSQIFINQNREYIKNLDDLPLPNWDLLVGFPQRYKPSVNSYLHLPAAHLMTSRGCTGRCIFCDRSVFGRIPRMYSAKKVMEMIDLLIVNYGIKEIQFFDDNFCLFPKRLEEICRFLMKKKPKISWSCQARADMVNPALLKLMKKAGCWQIGLGVESGSNRILRILKKQENKEMMIKAISQIAKEGIEVKGFFILGNPGETNQTLEETEKFIKTNPLTYVHTTFFTPYPGSEIFARANRYGKFLAQKKDWFKLGMGTVEPAYLVKGLSKKDLENEAKNIFKLFYFRPRIIIYHLRKIILTPTLWSAYLKGLISVMTFVKK